jgi:hypothetical protein
MNQLYNANGIMAMAESIDFSKDYRHNLEGYGR